MPPSIGGAVNIDTTLFNLESINAFVEEYGDVGHGIK
jgi:hypothetical protein